MILISPYLWVPSTKGPKPTHGSSSSETTIRSVGDDGFWGCDALSKACTHFSAENPALKTPSAKIQCRYGIEFRALDKGASATFETAGHIIVVHDVTKLLQQWPRASA